VKTNIANWRHTHLEQWATIFCSTQAAIEDYEIKETWDHVWSDWRNM